MASIFIAAVLTIFLSHLVPDLARVRNYTWMQGWVKFLANYLGTTSFWQGYFGLLIIIIFPIFGMWLVQQAFAGVGYGVASFLLSCAVLFYCWGPRDLDLDVAALIHANDQTQRSAAVSALSEDYPVSSEKERTYTDLIFQAALVRWFGVLFWFVILGPAGALLYRVVHVLAVALGDENKLSIQHRAAVERLALSMNWPAAQLMSIALAIASDFDAVLKAWKEFHAAHGKWFALNSGFLFAAARASVDADVSEMEYEERPPEAIIEAKDAMALVWRLLWVWGVAFALIVLAGKLD
jgi:AmpE protein